MPGITHVLTCRPGFESALAEEVADKLPKAKTTIPLPGLVTLSGTDLPKHCFVFEHTRLLNALHLPPEQLKPVTDQLVEAVNKHTGSNNWRMNVTPAGQDKDGRLARRAEGFQKALNRTAGGRSVETELAGLYTESGLWVGEAFEQANLRMKQDRDAPSRSYLKIEEVFVRWKTEPRRGQTAVDLGAAPGGWTYALLKRGCKVTAVDHGPLKIRDKKLLQQVTHLKVNGLTFKPRKAPVDWLVADMLISPGQALGLLKTWVGKKLARHFVVNIKLPQKHPWKSLAPIEKYLNTQPGTFTIRQLYHDRKEVTVWGRR